MKYTYDVFIAYHGTFSPDGSYERAKELEFFFADQGLKPYIFKEETGENWTDALRHIQESKTMLVVLNSGVLRDDLGRIVLNVQAESLINFMKKSSTFDLL